LSARRCGRGSRPSYDGRDDGRGGADFGRGSGLAGLKDRVEALGGRVWLRSSLGAGTTLEIDLPFDAIPPAANNQNCVMPAHPGEREALSAFA
jgi:hypothetical protein